MATTGSTVVGRGAAGRSFVPSRVLAVVHGQAEGQVLLAKLAEVGIPGEATMCATSLAAARRILAVADPECIFLDLDLPDAAGVEAVAVMLAAAPSVPIVALHTAAADADLVYQALAAGADDHLPLDALEAFAIREILERAGRRRTDRVVPFSSQSMLSDMLDAVKEPTCVVDGAGRILATNRSWIAVAELRGASSETAGVGANYLSVCDRAADEGSEGAAEVATGIRSVLVGETDRFLYEYSSAGNGAERWFSVRVTPLGELGGGAVVAHRDITDLKSTERRLRVGTEWVRRTMDEETAVFVLADPTGTATYLSESTAQLLGGAGQMVGSNVFSAIEPTEQDEAIATFRAVATAPDGRAKLVVHAVDPTGRSRELELEVRNRLDDPFFNAITVSGGDVTDARRRQMVRHLESRLLDRLPAAVVVVDQRGIITYWNDAATRIFGYSAATIVGRPVAGAGVWSEAVRNAAAALGPGGANRWEGEHDARRADGSSVSVRTTLERIDTEHVDFHGVVAASVDISDRRELELDLAYRTLHDPLTGLPNRHLFVDHLQRALSRGDRSGRHTAVLFADLDDFQAVNDRLGTEHGDQMLRAAAEGLKGAVRAGDLVARIGGDEFAVCCENLADTEEASAVAGRVLAALSMPSAGAANPGLSASIGVAFAINTSQPEGLLRNADIAMYTAKERGKNRIELFDDEVHRRSQYNHELAADLKLAIERDEIHLVFQPSYVLASGELFGFEALARWVHPERGPVMPSDFIRVAEATGCIVALGERVLEAACRALASWVGTTGAARPLSMAVNVSAHQLADPTFPQVVQRVLDQSGVPANCLCLEVAETALANSEAAAGAFQELKALGVETSIDDFGSEYSSLSRLHRFSIDYLKIDRAFVNGMTVRSEDAAIVDALLRLSRSLGVRSVAEGVEDDLQFSALKAAGCELGLGFFWSRPVPYEEATRLVTQTLPVGFWRSV
jgi:diguanylate cyclase (GGDEF)-like protein/PAS domain S-box-containing protein